MITREDVDKFTFDEYIKTTPTKLSREILPVGAKVMTLEGEWTCAEPSRLAVDNKGNVYPVAESVREITYRLM